jgi:hypothetical protein
VASQAVTAVAPIGGVCELSPEPPASPLVPDDVPPVPEDAPPGEELLLPHAGVMLARMDPATNAPKKLIRMVSAFLGVAATQGAERFIRCAARCSSQRNQARLRQSTGPLGEVGRERGQYAFAGRRLPVPRRFLFVPHCLGKELHKFALSPCWGVDGSHPFT